MLMLYMDSFKPLYGGNDSDSWSIFYQMQFDNATEGIMNI